MLSRAISCFRLSYDHPVHVLIFLHLSNLQTISHHHFLFVSMVMKTGFPAQSEVSVRCCSIGQEVGEDSMLCQQLGIASSFCTMTDDSLIVERVNETELKRKLLPDFYIKEAKLIRPAIKMGSPQGHIWQWTGKMQPIMIILIFSDNTITDLQTISRMRYQWKKLTW